MVISTIVTVIAFIVLFALCTRLSRDPVFWGILGIFISPIGAIIALLIYDLLVGEH